MTFLFNCLHFTSQHPPLWSTLSRLMAPDINAWAVTWIWFHARYSAFGPDSLFPLPIWLWHVRTKILKYQSIQKMFEYSCLTYIYVWMLYDFSTVWYLCQIIQLWLICYNWVVTHVIMGFWLTYNNNYLN